MTVTYFIFGEKYDWSIFFIIIVVSPFLIGQALWVASRFTPLMSAELLTRWVKGPYENTTATATRM